MHSLFLFTQYLIVAEALAAIAGFVTWKKWKQDYFKLFIIYLGIITLFDVWIHLLFYYNKPEVIGLVNEIIVPFEMLFINCFFFKVLANNKSKLIIAGMVLYVISWILEKTIFNGAGYYFESLSYTVGNLFILIYLILFFIELVQSEQLLDFKKLAIFWVVLGMLIFYLGTLPFFGLYNELVKYNDILIPAAWVETSLNYSMYLLFTIAFIWGKPQ